MSLTNRFKTNAFFRNSLTLSGGVAIAQLLPLVFYPVLGRIFTAEEFGLLASLTSITSVLAVVASGKYESGILIAKDKQEAANLAILSTLLSFVVLLAGWGLLQFVLLEPLKLWLKEPGLGRWIYICPLAAFSIVIFTIYNEWCVREKRFKALSLNKIINSAGITFGKVFFGLVPLTSQGLVLGDTLGRALSALGCVFRCWLTDRATFAQVTWQEMKRCAIRFKDLPLFTMPGQLLNTIGLQFPVLFIAAFFSKTEVGYFSMAMAIFALPINIISGALRDVFRQRATDEIRQQGNCIGSFRKITLLLTGLAGAGLAGFVWFLPWLMQLFLGPQWYVAGQYGQILSVAMAFSFVANTLSGLFIVCEKMKQLFVWQCVFVGSTIIAVLLGGLCFKSMTATLVLFSAMRSGAYLLSIIMTARYAKGSQGQPEATTTASENN